MDKMSREETLQAMKTISAQYGDNVIVEFSGDGLAALVESKKGALDKNRYFDSEICQNMDISDSEIEELCRSLKETAIRNTWQDSEKVKIMDVTRNILISWGVLKEKGGKVYPTNAYALLTGRMVGQPVIQCGVFKGTNRAHFVDRREFEGSIQEQMDAAYQYVLEKINMGMTIKGMYRQDVYELPTDSIRELIANVVAHRSYLEPGNIQVALYDDRLEIASPGMLLNNVTIEKMIEGYSRPRNPAIARASAYMKIIEKWGTGIPRLFATCEEYGLPKPELIDLYLSICLPFQYNPETNDST